LHWLGSASNVDAHALRRQQSKRTFIADMTESPVVESKPVVISEQKALAI
jgi:hypothetical protein